MEILYFGIAHEITGKKAETITLPTPISVSDIRKILSSTYPDLNGLKNYAIACNEMYVEDSFIIDSENIRIAILPPVSGG